MHLPAALAALVPDEPALAQAIATAQDLLHWITNDDNDTDLIGPDFLQNQVFAALIGQGSPIAAQGYELGFFLIAPHILYRDHAHAAPELYAPLTGPHGWRFGPTMPLLVKPAHELVWNDPHMAHMTKVGPVPFLCLYAWTGALEQSAYIVPADDWPGLEAQHLKGIEA